MFGPHSLHYYHYHSRNKFFFRFHHAIVPRTHISREASLIFHSKTEFINIKMRLCVCLCTCFAPCDIRPKRKKKFLSHFYLPFFHFLQYRFISKNCFCIATGDDELDCSSPTTFQSPTSRPSSTQLSSCWIPTIFFCSLPFRFPTNWRSKDQYTYKCLYRIEKEILSMAFHLRCSQIIIII